jgi:hypothetical protein
MADNKERKPADAAPPQNRIHGSGSVSCVTGNGLRRGEVNMNMNGNGSSTPAPRDYLEETLRDLELAKNKIARCERELAAYRAANPRSMGSATATDLMRERDLAHRAFRECLSRWSKAKGPTGSRPSGGNVQVNSFNRDMDEGLKR